MTLDELNNIFTAMLCHVDILRVELNRHPNGGEMPEIAFELRTLVQRGSDLVREMQTPSQAPKERASVITEKKDDDLNLKSGTLKGSGEHVFLVDDEEGLARIFGRLLQGLGYRVTVQTQSVRALELFEKDPSVYHVALIDLHMPPPGGLGVARRLHELRPELPIFIMSGYSDALGDTPPEDLGVVGILQKPVTRETLATELRKALDRPAAQ